jgi:peptidyl-prolyl cis-trans isomerase A (cyclophilin A)
MLNLNLKKYLFLFLFLWGLVACAPENPKVTIETEMGSITLEIYVDKASLTAANFLKYVQENRYKDAEFYRVVTLHNQPNDSIKIEVIQGGLWDDDHPDQLAPIAHETTEQTGILHKDGVISMARWHPGTATDDFFICVGNQPALDFGGKRNPDGQGFAAFGQVIKGMDVVKKIQQQPEDGQYLNPKIKINSIRITK